MTYTVRLWRQETPYGTGTNKLVGVLAKDLLEREAQIERDRLCSYMRGLMKPVSGHDDVFQDATGDYFKVRIDA